MLPAGCEDTMYFMSGRGLAAVQGVKQIPPQCQQSAQWSRQKTLQPVTTYLGWEVIWISQQFNENGSAKPELLSRGTPVMERVNMLLWADATARGPAKGILCVKRNEFTTNRKGSRSRHLNRKPMREGKKQCCGSRHAPRCWNLYPGPKPPGSRNTGVSMRWLCSPIQADYVVQCSASECLTHLFGSSSATPPRKPRLWQIHPGKWPDRVILPLWSLPGRDCEIHAKSKSFYK